MLSDTLHEISKIVMAAKSAVTSVLGTDCNNYFLKEVFHKENYQDLTDEEKIELRNKMNSTLTSVQLFINKVAETLQITQIDKNFIQQIKRLMNNAHNNIYDAAERESCLLLIEDYQHYKEFFDKTYQNIFNFASLSDISQMILKYKVVEKELKKDFVGQEVMHYGDYIVLKWQDEHEKAAIRWLRNKVRWCVIQSGYWKHYTRPYFLILKNYQPYLLVNVPSGQFKYTSNSAIKAESIDEDLIKITNQIYSRYYNNDFWANSGMYNDFNIFTPYYPIEAIEQGIKNKKINDKTLNIIAKNALKNKDNELIDRLIELFAQNGKNLQIFMKNTTNENQFRKIANKLYPKPTEANEQQWIRQNVKLTRNDLQEMILNSFNSGKSGFPLFKRLIKFQRSEDNHGLYTQTDTGNAQLLQQLLPLLIEQITSLGKLNQLRTIHQELFGNDFQISQEQAYKIYDNACKQSNVDKPMINFLLDNNLVELNNQVLYSTMKSGKDTIVKILLDKADSNYFNTPLYDDILPIFYCVKEKMPRILDILLESDKVNKNVTTANGRDVIWYALQLNDDDVLKKMVEYSRGVDFNKQYKVGVCRNNSVLSYCMEKHKYDIVEALLQINSIDVNKYNPIDMVIKNGLKNIVEKIISHNTFDPYYPNQEGNVPVMSAIVCAKFDIFELIANAMKARGIRLTNTRLTNTKTNMTPFTAAVDKDMPFEKIQQYFTISELKNSLNKTDRNSIWNIIQKKLAIKSNDENILAIKNWLQQQNKQTKGKQKRNLEQNLKSAAYQGNEEAFKDILINNENDFDFTKKINNYNLIYLLAQNENATECLKILLEFISNNPQYSPLLKGLLEQKFNYIETAYTIATTTNKRILAKYYTQEGVKMARKKIDLILSFVKNFIK